MTEKLQHQEAGRGDFEAIDLGERKFTDIKQNIAREFERARAKLIEEALSSLENTTKNLQSEFKGSELETLRPFFEEARLWETRFTSLT